MSDLTPEGRLRDEVLVEIAKHGQCYAFEAKAMARELIKLRAEAKPPEPAQDLNPYALVFGNGGNP